MSLQEPKNYDPSVESDGLWRVELLKERWNRRYIHESNTYKIISGMAKTIDKTIAKLLTKDARLELHFIEDASENFIRGLVSLKYRRGSKEKLVLHESDTSFVAINDFRHEASKLINKL